MPPIIFEQTRRVAWPTRCYQTSDGAVFYLNESTITAAFNGYESSASVPYTENSVSRSGCYGNAVYVVSDEREVYKATINSVGRVNVTKLRTLRREERKIISLLCIESINEQEQVLYRAHDGAKVERVQCANRTLDGLLPFEIQRGKLVCIKDGFTRTGVSNRGSNIIILEVREIYKGMFPATPAYLTNVATGGMVPKRGYYSPVYVNDSKFIYFLASSTCLAVLDTDTMQRQDFSIESDTGVRIDAYRIVGVHNGQIKVLAHSNGQNHHLWTGDLRHSTPARPQQTHSTIPSRRQSGSSVSEFRSTLSGSTSANPCAVCLEDLNNSQPRRALPCAHTFHELCIDRALAEKRECPLCRRAT